VCFISVTQLDPKNRVRAKQALKSSYFSDLPNEVYTISDGKFSELLPVLYSVHFSWVSCVSFCYHRNPV